MELTIENFRNIKIEQIEPASFVDKSRWGKAVAKFNELKIFIDEMLRIIKSNPQIPRTLVNYAMAYANSFLTFLKQISEETEGLPVDAAKSKERLFQNFDKWYNQCIEKKNGKAEFIDFYETFNTLKNLEKKNDNELIEITKIKEKAIADSNSLSTLLAESKKKVKSDADSIKTIREEVQKKASEVTMSDYAEIFGKESEEHNNSSWIWLGAGIILVGLFMFLLFGTGLFEKFPTEEVLISQSGNVETVKYNISNIIIKVLIFAVQIFLISFSFKQFSIGRHLKTINKHRQNGLNSFKLFVETISKDDTETRNSLMLQLAKSIYEQTSTGYISDKNQSVNSGIVEITKMIGANGPNA